MRDNNESRPRISKSPHPRSTTHTSEIADSRFDQAILDALPAHIALLDGSGNIVAVNKRWEQFGFDNDCVSGAAVGDNYFAASIDAASDGDEHAAKAIDGIRSVLSNAEERFSLEYPCHPPDADRWFRLDVSPIGNGPEAMAVVMHTDITDQRRTSELQLSTLSDLAERVKELDVLHRTAELLGLDPIPDERLFQDLIDLLPPAMRFARHAAARLTIGNSVVMHRDFPNIKVSASAAFDEKFIGSGRLEIGYTDVPKNVVGELFLPEERKMLESVVEILRSYLLRRNAVDHIRTGQDRLGKQNDALRELTHANIWQSEDSSLSLTKVTETVSAAMDVDRVSIWWLSDDNTAIIANDLYQSSEQKHTSGQKLLESDYPAYFAAIGENEVIAASDAISDPRTCEFADPYLRPQGISSMLDAPVIVHGSLRGVVCCEHVGERREWTLAEQTFVVSIASLVSMMVAQREKTESERRVRTTLDSVADGIHSIDAAGNILGQNAAAAAIFGDESHDLIGRNSHSTIHHHRADGSKYPLAECPIHKTLQDGVPRSVENELFFRPDGSSFPVSYSVSPLVAGKGPIRGAVISFRDITERVRAEKEINEQQTLIKTAQRIGNMGAWQMDLAVDRLDWSDETYEIFGLDRETYVPSKEALFRLILDEDHERVLAADSSATPDDPETAYEYRIRRGDGRIQWIYSRAKTEFDDAGNARRRIGMIVDITDRKRNELLRDVESAALEQISAGDALEDVLRSICLGIESIITSSVASITIVDSTETKLLTTIGPSLSADLRNVTKDVSIGPKVASCGTAAFRRERVVSSDITSDPLWKDYAHLAVAAELKACWSTPVIDANGRLLATFAIYHPEPHSPFPEDLETIERAAKLASIAIDRDRRQKELTESEGQFRRIFANAATGIAITSLDGRFLEANDAYLEMLGYTADELRHLSFADITHPDDLDQNLTQVREVIQGTRSKLDLVKRYIARDGRSVWVRLSVSLQYDLDGTPSGLIGITEDITKQIEAEDALKRSEAVAKFASRASSLGAWDVTLPDLNVTWSDETRAIYELEPDDFPSVEEALGRYTPSTRGLVEYMFNQCLNDGTPFDIEAGLTTVKGNDRWVRVIGEAVRGSNGEITGARGAIQDITHLKTAERKMAAIAHRLNTTLESMTEAFVILDADWNITYWNREAENVIGVKREDVLNKNLWDLFPAALDQKFHAEYQRALREQVPVAFEELLTPLNIWLDVRAYPTDEGLAIYFHDITEKRAAGEALKESEERFRSVVENTPQAVFIEVDGKFAYANPAALTLYGAKDPDELIGQPIIDRCHPDFRKIVGERIRFLTEERQALPMLEQALVTLAGDIRYANVTPMPFVYQGQPGALVFATDVTERKKADKALRESDEKFRQLASNIDDVFWIRSADMQQVLYISPGYERIWGRPVSDNAESPDRWLDFVLPEDRERVKKSFARLIEFEEQIDVEYRIVRSDGEIKWVRSRGFAVKDPATGERIRNAGIVTDVTEKKIAEAQMVASEQRYRTLFISNPLPMFVYDCESYKILDANDAAVSSYGYSLAEFRELDLIGLHREEDRESLLATIKKVSGPIRKPGIWRHVRKDGSHIDVEVTTHDVNFDGRRARLELANDVTERIKAQKGMYESEERFRLLAKATNDAIWDWDLKTNNLWWNDGFESITGFARAHIEASIEWWGNNIHPEDRDRIVAEVEETVRSGHESWSGEYRFGKSDGTYAFVLDRGYVIRDDDGTPVRMVGGMTDLTERRSLEEQLRQSQKMEAIGQLAGGIAHDFNNLLTVINGYSEMLLRRDFGDERARSALTGVHEAGKRAESLTRQLLAFSRRQPLNPSVVDLNGLLGSLWKMLDRLIGDDIELDAKFADDVARVKVDAGQYEQVLINLAVNARDAMPDGGLLLIETRNILLDDTYREIYPEVIPGRYVETSVSDTGIGMSKELIERIFEPFFTTKKVGKGTGLGLATVFGIVKQSGGHITVYSEIGVGTTFKIYLPALPADTASEPAHGMHVFDMPSGDECILLVEDAPAVRALLRDSLEECGYKIYEAQDGREALDLATELGDKLRLMVSDEVMPRLRGHELAAQVRELIPSCEILLVSGYTEESVLKQGILDAKLAFLQKPFTPSQLAKKVRELLDKSSSNGRDH